MDIVGILFDKDGTLVDFDATWGRATHAVLAALSAGNQVTYARLASAVDFLPAGNRFLPTSPLIAGSTAQYGHLWASILGRDCDPDFYAEIDRRFGVEALACLEPIGNPALVFAELQDLGFRLGVATNDAEVSARAQCERLRLLPYLDYIAGYDTGHGSMPGPGMVKGFARCLGVDADRVAVVGDSIHDLEAARSAGSVAIAVLTGPIKRAVLEPHADYVLESMADLPALLAAKNGSSQRARSD